jgi:hypothetical protein
MQPGLIFVRFPRNWLDITHYSLQFGPIQACLLLPALASIVPIIRIRP